MPSDIEYVTREELHDLRDHLREIADQQTKVIEERIKALTWRGLLALGVAVGLLRFNVPEPVTAGAVALAVGAAATKALSLIIGGRSL